MRDAQRGRVLEGRQQLQEVGAGGLLNHVARKLDIPVHVAARRELSGEGGAPVASPGGVRRVLSRHGVHCRGAGRAASLHLERVDASGERRGCARYPILSSAPHRYRFLRGYLGAHSREWGNGCICL